MTLTEDSTTRRQPQFKKTRIQVRQHQIYRRLSRGKMTLTEGYLNRKDFNRRLPQWKRISMEVELHGRQPQWNMT